MESLQIVKFSLNRNQGLDFTGGMKKANILKELEEEENAREEVPSEIHAYRAYLSRSE